MFRRVIPSYTVVEFTCSIVLRLKKKKKKGNEVFGLKEVVVAGIVIVKWTKHFQMLF